MKVDFEDKLKLKVNFFNMVSEIFVEQGNFIYYQFYIEVVRIILVYSPWSFLGVVI